MSEATEMLWLWRTPWGHTETSWKAALFHHLEIDFLANLPEYMNNQFWNSTELCQSIGYDNCEKLHGQVILKTVCHISQKMS